MAPLSPDQPPSAQDYEKLLASHRRLQARVRLLADFTRAYTEAATDLPRLCQAIARGVSELMGDTCVLRLVTDEPLPVNLDGEIAATTTATFEVDRNALHVVVPAASSAARLDGPGSH